MLDSDIDEEVEVADLEEPGQFVILCKNCQFHLSRSEFAIAFEGQHEHLQCNPHGHTFIFKCFSRVPGAILSGEPTLEFTWFPGYSWQYCQCQNCGSHLGWYFRNQQNDAFFGLIADKIIQISKN